jgi:hypothetical protein
MGSVLCDGVLAGTWSIERNRDAGTRTLVIAHVGRLGDEAASALATEGLALVRLLDGDSERCDVRFVPVG